VTKARFATLPPLPTQNYSSVELKGGKEELIESSEEL